MLRRNFIVLIFSIFSVVLWGCGSKGGPATQEEIAAGKVMYTTVNIWYDRPMKITPIFHTGAMIPVGTKVHVTETNSKLINFIIEGSKYRIYTQKYHRTTGDEFAKLIFSKSNPKDKGGKYHSFTKKERKNIDNGTIAVGMSRDAAIMSYGYPAKTLNHSINADSWMLHKSRYDRVRVTFKNNKISNIHN